MKPYWFFHAYLDILASLKGESVAVGIFVGEQGAPTNAKFYWSFPFARPAALSGDPDSWEGVAGLPEGMAEKLLNENELEELQDYAVPNCVPRSVWLYGRLQVECVRKHIDLRIRDLEKCDVECIREIVGQLGAYSVGGFHSLRFGQAYECDASESKEVADFYLRESSLSVAVAYAINWKKEQDKSRRNESNRNAGKGIRDSCAYKGVPSVAGSRLKLVDVK